MICVPLLFVQIEDLSEENFYRRHHRYEMLEKRRYTNFVVVMVTSLFGVYHILIRSPSVRNAYVKNGYIGKINTFWPINLEIVVNHY